LPELTSRDSRHFTEAVFLPRPQVAEDRLPHAKSRRNHACKRLADIAEFASQCVNFE